MATDRSPVPHVVTTTPKPSRYDWNAKARAEQKEPPGNWRTWLIVADRGWGATRTGAEWVRSRVAAGARRIAVIGGNERLAQDWLLHDQSSVLSVTPPEEIEKIGLARITWVNGATADSFGADKPERLRGYQFDTVWVDDLTTWRSPAAWDLLAFGLRLEQPTILYDSRGRAAPSWLLPRLLISTRPDPDPERKPRDWHSVLVERLRASKNTHVTDSAAEQAALKAISGPDAVGVIRKRQRRATTPEASPAFDDRTIGMGGLDETRIG